MVRDRHRGQDCTAMAGGLYLRGQSPAAPMREARPKPVEVLGLPLHAKGEKAARLRPWAISGGEP